MKEGDLMTYLNEHSLTELIRKTSSEDKEVLKDSLISCVKYVDTVASGEIKLLHTTEEQIHRYQDMVSQYDSSRHCHHEDAIVSTKIMNRLCASYNIAPIFSGDITQRHQIAVFCIEIVFFLFSNRRQRL